MGRSDPGHRYANRPRGGEEAPRAVSVPGLHLAWVCSTVILVLGLHHDIEIPPDDNGLLADYCCDVCSGGCLLAGGAVRCGGNADEVRLLTEVPGRRKITVAIAGHFARKGRCTHPLKESHRIRSGRCR